ncbi:MAG: hypothetical protein CMM45_03935 [Rhodospirillaceae bacterium]|nr:hypothetical protein [Rhodospirillaceae bacterium]
MTGLSILFVGQMVPGARTGQRVEAFRRLGCDVTIVETNGPGATYEDVPGLLDRLRYRFRRPADKGGANSAIRSLATASHFDIAWFERAVEIRASTLLSLKAALPNIKLVWYAEDDMMNPLHRTVYVEECISLYDLWVTTKSLNAQPEEISSLGAKRVLFQNNSYDPSLHYPPHHPAENVSQWGCDVGFVGTYEAPRAQSLLFLAENGVSLRVWGNGWEHMTAASPNLKIEQKPVYDRDYVMAVAHSKINLCFLRKGNRDLQTCRSIEIPAMGGFMLHERNAEISNLLQEDSEAVYFSDHGELLEKVTYWLSNERGRRSIASQGFEAISTGNFRHEDRLVSVFDALGQDPN